MANYNNPQATNSILNDINEIRELNKYNAKLNPSLGEGVEEGMIRLVDISGGKQIQIFTGSSWSNLTSGSTKLINNVDTIDGYHTSTSAVKGTIPVYNTDGKLVGSITGNAETATGLQNPRTIDVGGIATSEATQFDGKKNISIPLKSITINNDTDTAVNGVLTAAHGGTGRTDGYSLDVVVDSLSGKVKASDYGQIGRAKQITASTDFNTLVVDGNYASSGNVAFTIATNNAPHDDTYSVNINVVSYSNTVRQTLNIDGVTQYTRTSTDGGASWSGWTPIGGTKATVTLYVSKSGSDNNTGYSSEYPVATIARAIQIAKGAIPRASNGSVKLCIGEGNWGSVTFEGMPFSVLIYPFSGSPATEYSTSLPVFTLISATHSKIEVYSVVSTTLDARYSGYLFIAQGYKKTSYIRARYGGIVEIASQNATTNILDIYNSDITNPVIDAYHHGEIIIGDYQHILLSENINRIFLQANHLSKIHCYASRIIFDSTDAVNSGQKFQCFAGSSISTYQDGSNTLPTFLTSTLPGTGYTIEKGAIINGIPYGTAWDDDVLHLSGGTMTGNLSLLNAYSGRTTGSLTIGIGSAWNGAPSISFYGINDSTNPGYLELRAGANAHRLGLRKDGNMFWSGSLNVANGNVTTQSIELSGTTPFIDFHFNSSTTDYTSRIIETASGVLSVNGVKFESNKFTAYANSAIETSSNPVLSLRSTGSDGHKKCIRAASNGNFDFGNENLSSGGGCYLPSKYMSSDGVWNAIAVFNSDGKLVFPNGSSMWIA